MPSLAPSRFKSDVPASVAKGFLASFCSSLVTVRFMTGADLLSLFITSAGGAAISQLLRQIAPPNDAWEVAIQAGLVYANSDMGPAASTAMAVGSVPIAYISTVFAKTFLQAATDAPAEG
jgi:predicted permease